MKKALAFILTLVMLLSCLSVTAFAETKTPIESIDLTGLSIGTGWAGKTVSEVKAAISGYSGYSSQHVSHECSTLLNGEGDPLSDVDTFVADGTYYIQIILKADNGYYFNNDKQIDSDDANFKGTINPDDNIYATKVATYVDGGIGQGLDCGPEDLIYIALDYLLVGLSAPEEESKSGTTDITATKAEPFSYEIVFPTTVAEITAAGVYEVGQAKVTNVVSATEKTVISYTATTTDFTSEGKSDIPASYYTEEAAENAFPTDAVTVYENKADAENIPTMYVGISADAWNAADAGTYHATVTFNFAVEEESLTPMRRVYVGSMTTYAPICDDPATNLKVHYQGEGIDGLADLVSTGTTAIYDISSIFNYCPNPETFDVYYADIPEAATTYCTKNVKSGDESEADDWSNTANADGKILLVWDQVGGHANHLFDYTPAE